MIMIWSKHDYKAYFHHIILLLILSFLQTWCILLVDSVVPQINAQLNTDMNLTVWKISCYFTCTADFFVLTYVLIFCEGIPPSSYVPSQWDTQLTSFRHSLIYMHSSLGHTKFYHIHVGYLVSFRHSYSKVGNSSYYSSCRYPYCPYIFTLFLSLLTVNGFKSCFIYEDPISMFVISPTLLIYLSMLVKLVQQIVRLFVITLNKPCQMVLLFKKSKIVLNKNFFPFPDHY